MSRGEGAVLEVDDLHVNFHTDEGVVRAVDGVSWAVARGETLAIVGESGSGKSVSALAVMGLLPPRPAVSQSGRVIYRGTDLLASDKAAMRKLRGDRIAMIFQDPLSALNPVYKVGHQIAEVLRVHTNLGRVPARRRAVELLDEVGIPDPRRRADQYPHQFSGGMRQRVMIAMALALDPDVLLADEPTTALDVTVQAEIMALLMQLQARHGTAIVLITHDLGVVASYADKVLVMYAGCAVEMGDTDTIFYGPRHGYTYGLLASIPHLERRPSRRLVPIPGQPPSLLAVQRGCAFQPRCAFAVDECASVRPELTVQSQPDHLAACIRADDVGAARAPIDA
ncbi:MAG TPA: ABC transporter ATP-binding protein [Acidimicrobiales bacterium]|jgi:oligopeptide/dipeptide ABC transporter ATP-binding protein|nr:ABC transporter ATP-binding protein [Acidimicrobiales bacterium]